MATLRDIGLGSCRRDAIYAEKKCWKLATSLKNLRSVDKFN
jgi:hypothetical protein